MKGVGDLHHIAEDERIMLIGEQARSMLVGALIDSEPEKIARYIKKVTERYPDVRHVDTTPHITPHVSLVRFCPKTMN